MKITVNEKLGSTEVLALGLFESESKKDFNQELKAEIEEAIKNKAFNTDFGESYKTKLNGQHIIVFGLGKKAEVSVEKLRKVLGQAVTFTKSQQKATLATDLPGKFSSLDDDKLGQATAEALILANHGFTKYLSKEAQEKKKPLSSVEVQWNKGKEKFESGLKAGTIIAEATNFSRELVEEPANVVNSLYLEKMAKSLSGKNIKLKILNEPELKKEGMNSMLGVNKGSDNPPKLILLEYNGGKGEFTALVGKGITFDSGGYNIKPTRYIEDMKTDMGGAAAVLGTIKAASELGLKKNIVAVMAVCENMVSSKAQRPGDIVKAFNGKTIEIGNTDAEGRLVLADAIAYTENKYKPEVIIDIATLTGAVVYALGYYTAGMMGKHQELIDQLKKAGEDSGDRLWQMPFFDEYQDWMKGTISDLNNISTKGKGFEAGCVTGGVFLSKFVDKAKWAHIDIGGAAYWGVDGDYLKKGATGSGVRALTYYLMESS